MSLQREIKILLMEDDFDDFYLLEKMLNTENKKCYFFDRVSSVCGARLKLESASYDVILLDLGLDDSSGIETLRRVLELNTDCPIVVLTGVDDDNLGEKAIRLGAEDYVPKGIANTTLLRRAINYAIERHQLLLEIKKQSELDELTKLPNRSYINQFLGTLVEQSERNGSRLAVVMMDLDGFKDVNDTYGHGAGDDLLYQIANRLKESMRKSDAVARFGGDEFVMVVTNYKNKEELLALLELKHSRVTQPYVLESYSVEVKIGLSMGVSEWEENITPKLLFENADKAMYQCKKEGKNGVVLSK